MSVYSRYKIFHYPHKLNSLAEGAPITEPLHVRLKPTNVCNHRCSYCAYRQPDLQLGENMDERDMIPREKMREIVDDLVSMGVKAVTFSGGGEPLVYPYLLDTIVGLGLRGVKVASLTNGSRLTGDIAFALKKYGTWVRVSIDGWDGPSYAQYRGVGEGEFRKVLQNMAAFQTLGGACVLSACINVDATNALHVYDLTKRLVETGGVKSIKVTPIVHSNLGEENYAYHSGFVESVRSQVAYSQQDFPGVDIWNDYTAQLPSYGKAYTWCPMLQVRPVIAADLNVYSCQDKAYNPTGLLFSIKEQSFRDGWMSGDWRYRINPNKVCFHHCVSDNANKLIHEYLSIDSESGAYV